MIYFLNLSEQRRRCNCDERVGILSLDLLNACVKLVHRLIKMGHSCYFEIVLWRVHVEQGNIKAVQIQVGLRRC